MTHSHRSGSNRTSWAGAFLSAHDRDLLLALVPDPADAPTPAQRVQRLRDRAILTLFCFAGLRRNELRQLDRGDVQFGRQRVLVRHGKGGRQRAVPLTQATLEVVRAYLAVRLDPEPALFLSNRRRRISNEALGDVLQRYLPGLAPEERVTLHALRRTFATILHQRGASLQVIQQLLGHANPQTTMRHYIILVDDDLRDAVGRL